MNWLIAPIISSIIASILIIKIWNGITEGVSNSFLGVARGVLFVGAWVAIITTLGMRKVNSVARRINGSAIVKRLRTLASGGRS